MVVSVEMNRRKILRSGVRPLSRMTAIEVAADSLSLRNRSGLRMAMERGEGCFAYRFHNPAKGGQVEDKVGYALKVNGTTWAGSGTYSVRK